MNSRKKIIAGNWKMNKSYSESAELIEKICAGASDPVCDIVICPPSLYLNDAVRMTSSSDIFVGAQNVCNHASGAYTGEIAAPQLQSVGVKYVIIGHSERRMYYNETDSSVNEKIRISLDNSLKPIVCVGEDLNSREHGITFDYISQQVKLALFNISEKDLQDIVIAYEPIWAIGTGKTATPEQADEVCGHIRKLISGLYSDDVAQNIRILYGGSMNASNADSLLRCENIDGGLIGGASLKSEDFLKIIGACKID